MIIGLSGYARSGKDEIANILIEQGFKRIAFADKIRELLYEMNPNYHDTLLQQAVNSHGWDEVKQDPAIRRMLQNLGVGVRKVIHEEFWIAQALQQIVDDNDYVITDVRFANEARMIKEYKNSQLWRIKRPGVEAVNGHVSEHDLDHYKFDQVLKNEGSLDDLRTLVLKRLEVARNAD